VFADLGVAILTSLEGLALADTVALHQGHVFVAILAHSEELKPSPIKRR
jgi:hypothetical protein